MQLIEEIISTLPDGPVGDIRIGAFWTAVVVDGLGQPRCGLASTLGRDSDHHHGGGPAVREAGQLLSRSARELAALAHSAQPMEAAIGMATINALLPQHESLWTDINAGEVIARHGAGKRVVVVGHFPFVPTVQEQVGHLTVLEQRPRGHDLPAEAAGEVIPTADVVAITGTTLLNHTFEGLLALCRPEALVLQHAAVAAFVRARGRPAVRRGGRRCDRRITGGESGRQLSTTPQMWGSAGDHAKIKSGWKER